MELFTNGIKCVGLIFVILSFSKDMLVVADLDTLAKMCGLVEVPTDGSFPACCDPSVGPLGDAENKAESMLGHKPTLMELTDYYWDQVHVGHPRVFPICVTEEHIEVKGNPTSEFTNLIKGIYKDFRTVGGQRFYKFDKEKDLITTRDSWVEKIELSRINSMFSDMVNMRQWFHMKIILKDAFEGLLLHHVVGPLGLPVGEFSLEFNCLDRNDASKKMKDYGRLYYCDYRPMALAHHPQIYFGKKSGAKEFDVHFKYTQASCLETRYIQFIVVPVRSFKADMVKGKDFEMHLSPVYTMKTAFDSKDGFPYPVYLTTTWNYYYCFMKDQSEVKAELPNVLPIAQSESIKAEADGVWADIPWEENPKLLRILPNYEYEHCLLSENDNDKNNESLECPPGPFNCDENLRDKSDDDVLKDHEKWFVEETIASECIEYCPSNPTTASSTTVIPPSTPPVDPEKQISFYNSWQSVTDSRIHGLLEGLAYFVLIPIANLMARFYKENPNKACCNMQFWILGHVGLHLSAMVVAWSALGIVGTGSTVDSSHPSCGGGSFLYTVRCKMLNDKSASHISLSAIAFLAHHVHFVTGCSRSQREWVRKVQVSIHSIGGYASYALIITATAVSTPVCSFESFLFMGLSGGVLIIVCTVLTLFECKIDSALGVTQKRKHFPILDGIMVEPQPSSSPFRKMQTIKKFIIIGASAVIGSIWCLNLVSVLMLQLSGQEYIKSKGTKDSGKGIFGICEGVEEVFDYYK